IDEITERVKRLGGIVEEQVVMTDDESDGSLYLIASSAHRWFETFPATQSERIVVASDPDEFLDGFFQSRLVKSSAVTFTWNEGATDGPSVLEVFGAELVEEEQGTWRIKSPSTTRFASKFLEYSRREGEIARTLEPKARRERSPLSEMKSYRIADMTAAEQEFGR